MCVRCEADIEYLSIHGLNKFNMRIYLNLTNSKYLFSYQPTFYGVRCEGVRYEGVRCDGVRCDGVRCDGVKCDGLSVVCEGVMCEGVGSGM